jgi:hypothetical protein
MRMDRRTDRHDEANSRFSQFCERTQLSIVYYTCWDILREVGDGATQDQVLSLEETTKYKLHYDFWE